MAVSAKALQQFMAGLEPGLQRAFMDSVGKIRERSRLNDLVRAIELGNFEDALYAAGIRDYSWVSLSEAVSDSYLKSGKFITAKEVPKSLGLDFNITNPRARDWIASHSRQMVQQINLGQQRAIRAIITAGFEDGRNPRNVALDVIGRVSKQTGRRTGGVIGLHDQFADYAINARRELQELNPNYLTRARRDRRFNKFVERAIESGKPLTGDKINQIIGRYEDRLLQTRGETIARTAALSSMNAASQESMMQVVDEGLADMDAITKVWDASLDGRTRPDHAAADGKEMPLDQPFMVGDDAMMHPGDMSAPIEQTANCRCVIRHQISFEKTML